MNYSVKRERNSFLLSGKILLSGILLLCGAMSISAQTYFRTETGVPYIPVLATPPTPTSAGAIYINSADKAMYWYDGTQWVLAAYKQAPDGTVINNITSSTGRVWMDRNLGATQVATTSTYNLSYGSLYQWCRAADGHEKIVWTSATAGTPVNGTTVTLSSTTSPGHSLFIISANDWLSTQQANGGLWWNSNVAGVNSPCPTGYHVPTQAEWQAEITAGISNAATAYSALKLTLAGGRSRTDGLLGYVGSDGNYWSSTDGGTDNAYRLYFTNALAETRNYYRANGYNMRCIKTLDVPRAESVSLGGTVAGGSTVTGTYTYIAPQTSGSIEGASTYKWYYATDALGTGKTAISGATAKTYTIASPVSTGNYLAFGVTPVSADGKTGTEVLSSWQIVLILAPDGTVANTITSGSGRIWLDRNLGATQVATNSTDYLAYGSNFQWCRAADGHQLMSWASATSGAGVNGTTSTQSSTTSPGHSQFIKSASWTSVALSNGDLWWNGSSVGANNPCPSGYHVPTRAEWITESSYSTNASTSYANLKLTLSGRRTYSSGAVLEAGTWGYYSTSSTPSSGNQYHFDITASSVTTTYFNNGFGLAVRCIKN